MAINAESPKKWKKDIAASVDLFNGWFMKFAPKAYRDTRITTTKEVEAALKLTNDLRAITPEVLRRSPGVLSTLRMSTCPPLARDRLVGLAYVNKNLVKIMEAGKAPTRMAEKEVKENLERITDIIGRMLDVDIFPWLGKKSGPDDGQRHRASTIVADRLCGSVSDPIIRNAQERRQLAYIAEYLKKKGYREKPHPPGRPIQEMEAGTFCFRLSVPTKRVNIPIDCVIQPKKRRPDGLPILIEAKSAGDFTNVNKRRKEEATKVNQLRELYGDDVAFILFLCGYFDIGYLGYEAAEGIDWVWEHRIQDMKKLGL